MKFKLLMAICALSGVALFACTSGASTEDLNNAQGTATAAIARVAVLEGQLSDAQTAASDAQAAASEAEAMMMESTSERLQLVRDRGEVICASRNDVPGFGSLDDAGRNIGFDIDLCRAVAAAVLGDPEAISIQYITAAERGPTIQSGNVDVLVRTVTWTTSRDAGWGNYTVTMFYDGQGFMVPSDLNVDSAYDLGGANVCVTSGTTTELNMADFFTENNLEYSPQVFEDSDVVRSSYESRACDVFTSDRSQLAAFRSALPNPDNHVILPETISEEPLTPVVPHGDEQWFDVVKTVMSGLIYAEEYGITSRNIGDFTSGDDTKAKRLLGVEGSFGQETLGLDDDFMQDVLRAVGNYGEIYDRNLGSDGIGLPRTGRNRLWTDGGQLYAAPLR